MKNSRRKARNLFAADLFSIIEVAFLALCMSVVGLGYIALSVVAWNTGAIDVPWLVLGLFLAVGELLFYETIFLEDVRIARRNMYRRHTA